MLHAPFNYALALYLHTQVCVVTDRTGGQNSNLRVKPDATRLNLFTDERAAICVVSKIPSASIEDPTSDSVHCLFTKILCRASPAQNSPGISHGYDGFGNVVVAQASHSPFVVLFGRRAKDATRSHPRPPATPPPSQITTTTNKQTNKQNKTKQKHQTNKQTNRPLVFILFRGQPGGIAQATAFQTIAHQAIVHQVTHRKGRARVPPTIHNHANHGCEDDDKAKNQSHVGDQWQTTETPAAKIYSEILGESPSSASWCQRWNVSPM